jgi:hypothetical protein
LAVSGTIVYDRFLRREPFDRAAEILSAREKVLAFVEKLSE